MYKARREKLFALMKEGEAAIFFAETERANVRFRQDNNFLYFTGLPVPESVLFLAKTKASCAALLFIERTDPDRILWEGEKLKIEAAKKISGIERVYYLDSVDKYLNAYLPFSPKLFANYGRQSVLSPLTKTQHMLKIIKDSFPYLTLAEADTIITPLRSVKDAWEIQQLQKAIDITGEGLERIFTTAKAGMPEYELEAMLYHTMLRKGYRHWGFTPIIAAGANATTLHYEHNNCKIKPNTLVLCDVGAACNNYSADITRTFPIAEKFTKRQREIYEAVLDVQKTVIEMIKPGVSLVTLNEKTNEVTAEALLELKLIKNKEDYKKYYYHSVSHHLGLDTHDLGARDSVLAVGNVITVEPGIYVAEEKIGVRIEDDVLVTENGCQVLSEAIPKEAAELEKLRRKALK